MNIFGMITLILIVVSAIANIALGVLVVSKAKKREIRIAFAMFAFGIAFWELTVVRYALLGFDTLLYKLGYSAAITFFTGLASLSYVFPEKLDKKFNYLFVLMALAIVLIFSPYGVLQATGPAHAPVIRFEQGKPFILGYFLFMLGLISTNFYHQYHTSNSVVKRKIKFFILGTVLSMGCIIFVNIFMSMYFKTRVFAFLGPVSTSLMLGLTAYAILKYRMIEIEIMIKKATYFLLFYLFAIAPFLFAFEYINVHLKTIFPSGVYFYASFYWILFAIFLDQIRTWLQKATDRIFFMSEVDYEQASIKFGKSWQGITDIASLVSEYSKEIEKTLNIEVRGIFLRPSQNQLPVFLTPGQIDKDIVGSKLSILQEGHLLAKWIVEAECNCLIYDEVAYTAHITGDESGVQVQKYMDELKSSFLAGCVNEKSLDGILVLGSKKNGLPYNEKDIKLLSNLIQQMVLVGSKINELEEKLQYKMEKEAQEKYSVQVQEAYAELESFSYSASHDLRAPLRIIDGFSNVLLEEFSQSFPADAQRYLERISVAAKRGGQLIDDLLKVSRIARTEVSRKKVNLSQITKIIMDDLIATSASRKIDIQITPDIVVMADPGLMQSVLENLIGNAWKFTRDREITRISFDVIDQNGTAVYCLSDNGVGFDMRFADKLFGVFQRLHKAEEYEGSGIGLATVKRIIAKHGGNVWAESMEGEGSTFYFTLTPKKPVGVVAK